MSLTPNDPDTTDPSDRSVEAFPADAPVDLRVEIGCGSVTVTATDIATEAGEAVLRLHGPGAEGARVELRGPRLSVVAPRGRGRSAQQELHVDVTVPTSSSLRVELGSADLTATGRYHAAHVRAGSGDVSLEVVEDETTVDTGSGEIQVDDAGATARLRAGSGDVRVDRGHDLSLTTGSGDVRVGDAGGAVQIRTGSGDAVVASSAHAVVMTTGSGDLRIDRVVSGTVQLKGASGDCSIGVPHGTPVWTDVSTVSGRLRSDLPHLGAPVEGQDHVEVRVVTVSGDVELRSV